MKDVLCTRSDWVNQGRGPSTLDDFWYADGDEKFITIEGIQLRDPVHKAENVLQRVQRFLTYLLKPSNKVIGTIMGIAFEPLAPPAQVMELQRVEVALQNKLNQFPHAVHAGLIGTMQTNLVL